MTTSTRFAGLLASPVGMKCAELLSVWLPFLEELEKSVAALLEEKVTPAAACLFEQELSQSARRLCRQTVQWVYNRLEADDPQCLPAHITWEGERYRRRANKTANAKVATLFGIITLRRYRYEPLEPGERSIFPLEKRLGIEARRATPALAERVGWWAAHSTQGSLRALLRRDHDVRWSVKTLRRVTASFSSGMSAFREPVQAAKVVEWLEQAEAKPGPGRPTLSVGRDGVMVPLRGRDKYREAATATVSVLDRRGKRCGTVYLGRMPEKGQKTLSAQLTAVLLLILRQWLGKLPRLQYVTDGGSHPSDYFRAVLKRLRDPGRRGQKLVWEWVCDFYHACTYITKMAEALFGEGRTGYAWASKMRRWLRDKPRGVCRVLYSAGALESFRELTRSETKAYEAAWSYLSERKQHMDYAGYRRRKLAIGSGVTEAACKTVFSQRLKQSGMRWSVAGGQVIVDLRVIYLSGIWEEVHRRYLASQPVIEMATIARVPRKPRQIAA